MTADEAPWKSKASAKFTAVREKIPKAWRLSPEYLKGDENSDFGVFDVPAKCGILSAAELAITENYTAVSLARAVQSGSLKSKDVATAFCKRAAIATQLTNCCTETMFDDALKRGEELDKYLAEHKKPMGPLHGVPVSIKDSFHYPGVQSSIGFVSFLDHPEDKDAAALVQILLELGAILYCKTNIPQTLMTGDSQNHIFGRTLNPHKLKLNAGGSSGGEGALVAFRGSILGVGTDIGGSIRIPALCNGTYGFKPSSWRVPYGGQTSPAKIGSPGFPPVAGPLANSFEDLHFFVKHVIEAKPWNKDFLALAIPWRAAAADMQFPRARIGYLLQDEEYPVHPPVKRTLEESAKKLAAAGFDIVPIKDFPSLKQGIDIATDCYSLDNDKTTFKYIKDSGEPKIESLRRTEWAVNKKEKYTLEEVFDMNAAWFGYKAGWHKIWTENQLDVILCPGAENTAVLHDTYGIPAYTAVWNLLEYPGVIIPIGKADREKDKDELADPNMKRPYRAEDVHGAPTSIQLIAQCYQDEELIAAAAHAAPRESGCFVSTRQPCDSFTTPPSTRKRKLDTTSTITANGTPNSQSLPARKASKTSHKEEHGVEAADLPATPQTLGTEDPMDSDDDLSLASSAELEVDDDSSVGDFGQDSDLEIEEEVQDGFDFSQDKDMKPKKKAYETDYAVYSPEDIQKQQDKQIDDVATLLEQPHEATAILLRYGRWNKERLLDQYMENPEKTLDQAGLGQDIRKSPPHLENIPNFMCEICCETDPGESFAMKCGHRFCLDCYRQYLTQKIRGEGEASRIKCPGDGCNQIIDAKSLDLLVTNDLTDRYHELLMRTYVDDKESLKWCPAPECVYAIECGVKKRDLNKYVPTVTCECKHSFCFGCTLTDHQPCPCSLVKKWLKKCEDDSETANWISANTKECPKCLSTIEKNGGCNHMTCRKCRHEFCWMCMGVWSEHGTSWYNCNRFEEKSGTDARDAQAKSRQSLERYLHYYNRYANHEQSAKLDKDIYHKTERKMTLLQSSSGLTWIEVQFLEQASQALQQCRQTLKWTYAFAYYLARNNQTEIFEDNQKDLEMAVENLSEMFEKPTDQLKDLKVEMMDKTAYCKKRRVILLDDTAMNLKKENWEFNVSL